MKTWLTLALALFMLGCGPKYMVPVQPPQALAANSGSATIVFIRPSSYAGGEPAVLDGRGNFLGCLPGESRFAVVVSPGEHTFIVWHEGTPALVAQVEAGKIYYVELSMIWGWSGRARLFAVGPNRKQWNELPEWLSETEDITLAPNGREKFIADHDHDLQEVVAKGIGNWGEYDAEARGLRSLTPADGVAAAVAPQ